MNKYDFESLYLDKVFADLKLVLTDASSEITLNVHKSILYGSSKYFSKLLTCFSDGDKNVISIRVLNVSSACRVIKSFYGIIEPISDWREMINDYWTREFFGIENQPIKASIPSEEFDELVNKIDSISYNRDMIKLILDNIPKDYDLSVFPYDLLEQLSCMAHKWMVVFNRGKKYYVVDLITSELINKYKIYYCMFLTYDNESKKNRYIYNRYGSKSIHSIDGTEPNQKYLTDSNGNDIYYELSKYCLIPPSNKFVLTYGDKKLVIFDNATGKCIRDIGKIGIRIDKLFMSVDYKTIIVCDFNIGNLIDVESGSYFTTIRHISNDCIDVIYEKYIAYYNDDHIKIVDYFEGTKILHIIKIDPQLPIEHLIFSLDGNYIITVDKQNTILVRDLIKYQCRFTHEFQQYDKIICVRNLYKDLIVLTTNTNQVIKYNIKSNVHTVITYQKDYHISDIIDATNFELVERINSARKDKSNLKKLILPEKIDC